MSNGPSTSHHVMRGKQAKYNSSAYPLDPNKIAKMVQRSKVEQDCLGLCDDRHNFPQSEFHDATTFWHSLCTMNDDMTEDEVGGNAFHVLPNDVKLIWGKVMAEKAKKEKAKKQRSYLPSGLIIEELSHGPPDGAKAVINKKVKIYYSGTVKATGHVFASNAIFRFKLGDEAAIDGWNIGIDGMRVGDKRRLIIPPHLGFGDEGKGQVPPKSWVEFEIELLRVRN